MTSPTVVTLTTADADRAVAIWEDAWLTRPWNPPAADFLRAVTGSTSAVLGVVDGEALLGTVMVGHDGHRGWIYYLAVVTSARGQGLGKLLTSAAETWLREHGAVKVQLMVRSENAGVLEFYERLGYEDSDVRVKTKWL